MVELAAHLEALAKALELYEDDPYSPDTASAVDEASMFDYPDAYAAGIPELLAVVALALDEDGFRFIPVARVLCAAVQEGI
jgi:hypothetical protein